MDKNFIEMGTNSYSDIITNVSCGIDFANMLKCSKCKSCEQMSIIQQQRADCLQNTVKYLLALIESCGDSKCRRLLHGNVTESFDQNNGFSNNLNGNGGLYDVPNTVYTLQAEFEETTVNNDIISESNTISDVNSNVINNSTTVIQSNNSYTEYVSLDDDTSSIKQITQHDISDSSITPYYYFSHTQMGAFSADNLFASTVFTHIMDNRSVCYYGDIPYRYGNVSHNPQLLQENTYLVEILKAIKSFAPFLLFNSVMVQAYNGPDSGIPPHSDNEYSICPGSQILTLSLGEARNIEFTSMDKSVQFSRLLEHGSVLTMSHGSQKLYKHCIPTEQGNGLRVSITLRLLRKNPSDTNIDNNSELSSNEQYNTDETLVEKRVNGQDSIVNTRKSMDMIDANETHPTTVKQRSDVLYISSSMFSHFNSEKLSSKTQNEHVFSYSGKDSCDMFKYLTVDPKFKAIDPENVSKVFILCGTNDVKKIYYGQKLQDSHQSLDKILIYLYKKFSNATINIINLFSRDRKGSDDIVNSLNEHIFNLVNTYDRMEFIDTKANLMFNDRDGYRKKEFFHDEVHLNDIGIIRICKHLKYISHNDIMQ